jgi:hypothetical protein
VNLSWLQSETQQHSKIFEKKWVVKVPVVTLGNKWVVKVPVVTLGNTCRLQLFFHTSWRCSLNSSLKNHIPNSPLPTKRTNIFGDIPQTLEMMMKMILMISMKLILCKWKRRNSEMVRKTRICFLFVLLLLSVLSGLYLRRNLSVCLSQILEIIQLCRRKHIPASFPFLLACSSVSAKKK